MPLLVLNVDASWNQDEKTRCVIIEVYIKDGDKQSDQALEVMRSLARSRGGIRLAVRKVNDSQRNRDRLKRIADHFKFSADQIPVIYCCNQVVLGFESSKDFRAQVEKALSIEVFVRQNCPHCDDAKKYLAKLPKRYPGFEIVYRDILAEVAARGDLNQLVRKYKAAAVSTPVFHFCNSLSVGFDREATTGKRIEKKLERWTIDCSTPKQKATDGKTSQNTFAPSNPSQELVPGVAGFFPFSLASNGEAMDILSR